MSQVVLDGEMDADPHKILRLDVYNLLAMESENPRDSIADQFLFCVSL